MACVPNDVRLALENYYLPSNSALKNLPSDSVIGTGPFVQGTIFSRGRGLGSIIRSAIRIASPLAKKLGKVLKPVAKKVGRYALERGVETAADIATDVLTGVPPKEAFNYNTQVALENAKYDAVQKIQTIKRKARPLKPKNAKRQSRLVHENF